MRLFTAVIDSRDPQSLARWWATVLGWEVTSTKGDEVIIAPPAVDGLYAGLDERTSFDVQRAGMCFVRVAESKQVKNRVHLDFAPHVSEDRDLIIEGFLTAGARPVDVGQADEAPHAVLEDPEGNEFCIISRREE